jgi:hypothetical protein
MEEPSTSRDGEVEVEPAPSVADAPLAGSWDLSYHLPQDKNWTLASYVPIAEKVATVG